MTIFIPRRLDLEQILADKSCFLFGPRQTGKSTLIAKQLSGATVIDLLDDEVFLRLQKKPSMISDFAPGGGELVVIDEIQRIPKLLYEVHRLIEKRGLKFLLTGSSARKLRRKGVNLLGGRARSRVLHPLVSAELKDRFDLTRAIQFGLMPSVYFSPDPWDDLKSYVSEYIKEEIITEAATRNLPAFSRFLEVAAISNSAMLNYEKISNDAQVPRSTVQSYYEILRHTLLGRDLPAFRKTKTRKAIRTHKFFFFDVGVVNYLKGLKAISDTSADYGFAFEAFMHHELSSYCDYEGNHDLTYWRSQSGFEVDFLLDAGVAIEVKSTRAVSANDLRGILALAEEISLRRKIIVCREPMPRTVQGIEILPVANFLEKLWSGELAS